MPALSPENLKHLSRSPVEMMAQISLDRHFYLPNAASWDHLKSLQERYAQGSAAGYTNRHAWESILHLYFPSHYDPSLLDLQPGQTAQGTLYGVTKQFFDQDLLPSGERGGVGEVIALRRTTVDLPAHTSHHRDILWVICCPPGGDDDQDQWMNAMIACVGYLGWTHPSRALYFILAVGMRWLPFYCDPNNWKPWPLRMKDIEVDGNRGWYIVDHDVRAPPGVDAPYVDAESGVIRTDLAKSLDCFTAAAPVVGGGPPRLAFQEDLDFLEEFLGVVAGREYVGEND